MTKWLIAGFAMIVILLALPASAGEPAGVDLEPCASCHDQLAGHFQMNPHLLSGAVGTNPCVSCHAGAEKHAEEGDPELVTIPTGVDSSASCITCHGGVGNSGLHSEAHATAGVGCVDCHTIHQEAPRAALLERPVGELCASCHPVQQGQFRKPYAHKLGRGDMSCVSCHNPHAGRGEDSLKQGAAGQGPCVSCHSDTRGPFVFPHVGDLSGDCMTCHEPHGSSNPKRLVRARVDQLCLECHSTLTAGTMGSQPPSFHDLRSARYRECTTCHVAVHGSQTSPALLK